MISQPLEPSHSPTRSDIFQCSGEVARVALGARIQPDVRPQNSLDPLLLDPPILLCRLERPKHPQDPRP